MSFILILKTGNWGEKLQNNLLKVDEPANEGTWFKPKSSTPQAALRTSRLPYWQEGRPGKGHLDILERWVEKTARLCFYFTSHYQNEHKTVTRGAKFLKIWSTCPPCWSTWQRSEHPCQALNPSCSQLFRRISSLSETLWATSLHWEEHSLTFLWKKIQSLQLRTYLPL